MSELTQSLYRDDRLAQWLTETVARLPVRHFTDQRLDRLSEETTSLAAAVGQLAESHRRAEAKLGTLTERVDRLTDVVGRLRGDVFELKYRDKVEVYFGPLARRVEGVRKRELEDALEAKLTHEELLEVLRLDLLVGGQPRRLEPRRDALVAAEVSAVIDRNDVGGSLERFDLGMGSDYCRRKEWGRRWCTLVWTDMRVPFGRKQARERRPACAEGFAVPHWLCGRLLGCWRCQEKVPSGR